jgi:hypothetical protein
VELSDFVPAVFAGVERPEDIVRGVCMAGHKAMYADEWGGLPDEEFLAALDPKLADLRPRLYQKAVDVSARAGSLCPEWAAKLGLPAGIAIAVGEMDVHYGAIGCGVDEGTLVKVIGTSTCDCAVVPMTKKLADIPGICGIVPGAILPGFFGIEAGQSAVGDIFKWWVEGICGDASLHAHLTREAAKLKPGQSGLLALDWHNGNRTDAYDLSPWSQTLVLDADYVVASNQLLTLLEVDQDFLAPRLAYDITGLQTFEDLNVYGRYKMPMTWATVMMFRRSATAEMIFNCMSMIKNNWQHYRNLYGINRPTYRNDFALSIATGIVDGHTLTAPVIPWKLASLTPEHKLMQIDADTYRVEYITQDKKSRYITIKHDFHAMGKHHLGEIVANNS